MTLSQLIRILEGYERAYGDLWVTLADDQQIIGDCNSVGIDPETGDCVLSIQD